MGVEITNKKTDMDIRMAPCINLLKHSFLLLIFIHPFLLKRCYWVPRLSRKIKEECRNPFRYGLTNLS
jgi:hypothetical protein